MRFSLLLVCVVVLLASAAEVFGSECHGSPSPDAKPNMNAIYSQAPTFVRQVPNGKLYTVGQGDDTISIVHLWGSPYEKGFAHGSLMKEGAQKMLNMTWTYFEDEVIQAINQTGHSWHIPQNVIDEIANFGLDVALDITYEWTKPFTGDYFYQEMQGLSDSSGVDYDTIRRIHMIGELTKGSCSMYGVWGNATASLGGRLLQLRALDWAVDGPFKNFPQITVYHNDGSSDQGFSFANIGWTGWIGSITGLSENRLGISEIGVAFPDPSFGNESREGIPFTNILRDIIQFDKTLQDAETRITNANRTCDLILGVGDGKSSEFRGVEYSYSTANFYTDTNMMPYNETWHPRIPDVVYYGMDWLCPSYNGVLAKQILANYGTITPEVTIQNITSIVQTGDLLVAIYDLQDLVLYTANARRDGASGPANAYDRQFVRVDVNALFQEKP